MVAITAWLRPGRGDHGTRGDDGVPGRAFRRSEMVRWLGTCVTGHASSPPYPRRACVRARTNDDWVTGLRRYASAPIVVASASSASTEHTITGMSWV